MRIKKLSKVKILCLLLALMTVFSLFACKDNGTEEATDPPATPSQAAPATPDQVNAETIAASINPSEELTVTIRSDETITYSAATAPAVEEVLQYGSSDPNDIYDATGFVNVSAVIPDAELEIRYYTSHNFVGEQIDGYEEPIAILTKEAAAALMKVNDQLKEKGYRIKIYDAYRPRRAVNHFVAWANDWSDTKMKSEFYPELDKSVLINYGYISGYSGHSRGSTVDLTLVDAKTGKDVDMGGSFDYFGTLSHPDYTGITSEQYNNRMILREAMINNGFSPLSTEWWHFSLNGEPYPNTYFDFPVSTASLGGS